MKRFSYGIFALMLTVLSFACQTEEIAPQAEIPNQKNALRLSYCNISGSTFALEPSSAYSFNFNSNLDVQTINWSVTGNAVVELGQGTSQVTILTFPDFDGGSISATASGTDINGDFQTCSRTKALTTADCTPPTAVYIAQDYNYGGCIGEVFRFTANPNNTSSGGSYSWSVTNGASITSGQGTNAILVQSPLSVGFTVSVTYTSNCQGASVNDTNIAQYSSTCN